MPQYNENVLPANTLDVGSADQPWRAGYFSNLYLNGVALPANSTFSSVTFSANPTFTMSGNNSVFHLILSANVLSSTLTGAVAGNLVTFILVQNATGGWTFAWPATVLGGTPIGLAANQVTVQTFVFDGTSAYALAPASIYP